MNDFQKRLEEAEAAEALQEQQDEPVKEWWREALEEFVDYLNQKHGGQVHARLSISSVSGSVLLQFAPATRWSESSTALVLQGSNDRAIVLGRNQVLFQSRKELEEYLVRFVRSAEFRSTLRDLDEKNAEPSEGYLRFGGPQDRDPRRDVMVGVPADVQRRIAEGSARGEEVDLGEFRAEVLPSNVTARGKLDPSSPPQWLASGGFLVSLKKTTILDERTALLRGATYPGVEEDAA